MGGGISTNNPLICASLIDSLIHEGASDLIIPGLCPFLRAVLLFLRLRGCGVCGGVLGSKKYFNMQDFQRYGCS